MAPSKLESTNVEARRDIPDTSPPFELLIRNSIVRVYCRISRGLSAHAIRPRPWGCCISTGEFIHSLRKHLGQFNMLRRNLTPMLEPRWNDGLCAHGSGWLGRALVEEKVHSRRCTSLELILSVRARVCPHHPSSLKRERLNTIHLFKA